MMSERKINEAIFAWMDKGRVIPDALALELFAQFRGSSDYPFAGVGAGGILDDAEGVLRDIQAVADALPFAGHMAQHEELAALKGWVQNWQNTHVDVDGEVYEIIPVTGPVVSGQHRHEALLGLPSEES